MHLVIKDFKAQDGERYSLIFDADDSVWFPLYYPSVYTSHVLRPRCAHNTIKTKLYAIKKLYEWTNNNQVDLNNIFLKREFFQPYQIDSLCESVKKKKKNRPQTISPISYNAHIETISEYLRWLALELITDSNDPVISRSIDRMHTDILTRRLRKTGSKASKKQELLNTRLSEETRGILLSLFSDPLKGGVSRRSHVAPRYRNILALHILYDTGMRLGELLGLRLQDFVRASGGEKAKLIVRRYHDDIDDDRVDQPVAKTLPRYVPINKEVEEAIENYLKLRANVPHVGYKDNDVLFVNHLGGVRQGKPLTEKNFRSALLELQEKFPALEELHPHLLRHDWNYRFSNYVNELGWHNDKIHSVREYLMGWVEGSAMSRIYDGRKIMETAAKVGLMMADDVAKFKDKGVS